MPRDQNDGRDVITALIFFIKAPDLSIKLT